MPEYLAPGVYIEEIGTAPRPIEGVGTSTARFTGVYLVEVPIDPKRLEGGAVAHEWHRLAGRVHSPGWTDANAHDPGVTMLELLAYGLEMMALERNRWPDAAARAAARIASASLALLSGVERRSQDALSAVAVLGANVAGLAITTGEGPRVTIAPGSAVDRSGRDVGPDDDGLASKRRAVRRRRIAWDE